MGRKISLFHKYAFILHEKLPDNILLFLDDEKHQIPTKAAHKLNK